MRNIFIYFGLVFVVAKIKAQTTCRLPQQGMGECVLERDCPKKDVFAPEDLREYRDRLNRCKSIARKSFICCDNTQKSTLRPPAKVTSKIPNFTTQKIITTAKATLAPKLPNNQKQVSIENHKNFKHLDLVKCGTNPTKDKVAFGENAELGEFPWAALLGYQTEGKIKFSCGGSLISKKFVLTAAHCIAFLPSNFALKKIRLGEYDLKKDRDCINEDADDFEEDIDCSDAIQEFGIDRSIPHPNYSRESLTNDIGIVKMTQNADLTKNNVQTICLPFSEEHLKLPPKMIVAGWGKTEKNLPSNIIQKALVPLFDNNKCMEKLSKKLPPKAVIDDFQFCAGGQGKTDACKGDSGGPIQYIGTVNGTSHMVLYGIVSYGVIQCGELEGFPGVYTKTSKYIEWILDNMN